jgi:hypothetical protein
LPPLADAGSMVLAKTRAKVRARAQFTVVMAILVATIWPYMTLRYSLR